MLCILIDELRLSNWLDAIMQMYQVPPNPKLFKITFFYQHCQNWRCCLDGNLSLCMDIADEIEVSTSLEMQLSHYHSIPFDNVSLSMTKKKPAKHCAARSEVLFCLFSQFCRCCGCVEVCSSATMLNNSWYGDFPRKTYFRRYPYTGTTLVSNWREFLADILSFQLDG